MGFNAWLNIPIANATKGIVYRIWKAVSLLSGGMAGLVTVKQVSTTGWTSDASPEDGAWVVLEWVNAWATGEKQQVFVGVRATTGNLAGFGSKGAGCYVAMSTIGGWDLVNHWFGASLADWRNGLFNVQGQADGTTLALVLSSGIANQRPGALAFSTRSGSGPHQAGAYCGALVPPGGFTDQKYRSVMLWGCAQPTYLQGWSMGKTDGTYGRCPVTTLDATHQAHFLHVNDSASGTTSGDAAWNQDVDGGYHVAPLKVRDVSTARRLGNLDGLGHTSAPDGTISSDGTRWAWNNVAWPREAARDGQWV